MPARTRIAVGVAALAVRVTSACSDVATNPVSPLQPTTARASGGPAAGGGGGGLVVPATGFAGNWSGTIVSPDLGAGLFTLQLSVVGTSVTGHVFAGKPIFDSGFNMSSGKLTSPTTFVGLVARSHGFIEITGTLSADGTTITGVFGSNAPGSLPYSGTRQ
jgi:hypothetical protein